MQIQLTRLTMILSLCSLLGCVSHRTRPLLDAQSRPRPDSVASLEPVVLGGVQQWILIRGNHRDSPILLKLHGGPGQAEMATAGLNDLLEKDFVVVEWDQRGAGKSARAIEPRKGMTIDQFVEDTRELTELLLRRFHQRTLILVGHSWGSIIGLKAVQKYPRLYRAFVSTGQNVNLAEAMGAGYSFLMDEATRRNDRDGMKDLAEIGPPPYLAEGSRSKREVYLKWLGAYGGIWHSSEKFDRVGWMIRSVEYAWPEKLRYTRAANASFERLLPEMARLDMTTAVPKVDVPVYFAVGRFDHLAPTEVTQKYFSALVAPKKDWIWFEQSAHFPQWEERTKFHDLLTHKVLPETEAQPQG